MALCGSTALACPVVRCRLYQKRQGVTGGPSRLWDEMGLSSDGKRRQLAGSRRGAAAVSEEFDAAITRRRYCALVGIHPTTLRRWEQAGVVRGKREAILGIPTTTFTEVDVDFGRRLVGALRARPGEVSLEQAAARATRNPGRS